jgi:hypothetical protein
MHPDPLPALYLCMADGFENPLPSLNPGSRFPVPGGNKPDANLI